jgi:hypothetical protein
MQTRTALKFVLMWVQVLVVFSLIAPLPVRGQVQGPIMSPFIEIWTDLFENNHPSVAYNSRRNEFMVVWYTKESVSKWTLWGRKVKMDGTLGGVFEIRRYEDEQCSDPVIVYNPEKDEYLVAFKWVHFLGLVTDIGAHLINWEGTRTRDIIVAADIFLVEEEPAVALNKNTGEYLVVWTERENPTTYNIKGRRIDALGNPLEIKKLAGVANEFRGSPAAAYNALNNNYFIVYGWEGGTPPKILGVTCSADLGAIGLERQVSGGTVDMSPTIAFGAGEFEAVWWKVEHSVLARRISAQGDPLGPASGYTSMPFNSPIYPRNPDIAYLGKDLYLSVAGIWNPATADEGDIAGRLLKTGLDQPYEDLFNIDASPNLQSLPRVACDSHGNCLVVYVHNPIDYPGGTYEIRGRLLNFFQTIYLPLLLKN